jgi:hypothetical protein
MTSVEVWSLIDDIGKILDADDFSDALNGIVRCNLVPGKKPLELKLNRGYTEMQIEAILEKFKGERP